MQKTQLLDISKLKLNKKNPRTIRDEKFEKLVKSIKDFPKMLELRPIVVNKKMVILGGNMRFRAAKEAGIKKIPVLVAENLTAEQEKEFIIKDNVGFGEWDWDVLANEWDEIKLSEWGIDIPIQEIIEGSEDGKYTRKIEAPIYSPSDTKPEINELFDIEKYNELVKQISSSVIPDEIKMFLIRAAGRHVVFNYSKIADYYAHAEKPVQELMEKSALVIIDFDKAIENGFVELSEQIAEQFKAENNEG